jgi:hypothetical protein
VLKVDPATGPEDPLHKEQPRFAVGLSTVKIENIVVVVIMFLILSPSVQCK